MNRVLTSMILSLALVLGVAPPTVRAASTVRVDVGVRGRPANGPSQSPAVSLSGRWVAFASDGTNLVTGDTNGRTDVFLRDLQTAGIRRVSIATGGGQGNGRSWAPAVSSEGRYVAFTSDSTNLVPGDTNGVSDVFRRDLSTGLTIRVSVGTGGVQANGPSSDAALSGNARFVAFSSDASNLTVGDGNGLTDVFVRDVQGGTSRRMSTPSILTDAGGSQFLSSWGTTPSISTDGRYVAYQSSANVWTVLLLRDRVTGTVKPVSCLDFGYCSNPVISGDGKAVAFGYSIPAGFYGLVKDLDSEDVWQAWSDTYEYALSYDGRTFAFTTDIPSDPDVTYPLYVLTQGSSDPELVADGATGPSLSGDACRLAYALSGGVYAVTRC